MWFLLIKLLQLFEEWLKIVWSNEFNYEFAAMPCAACSLQMGKFMRSSSQSSSRRDCSTFLAKRGSSKEGQGMLCRSSWQIVLITQLISSLSPILIQTQARQSVSSLLVRACCGWLGLLYLPSPMACRGPAHLPRLLHLLLFRRSACR